MPLWQTRQMTNVGLGKQLHCGTDGWRLNHWPLMHSRRTTSHNISCEFEQTCSYWFFKIIWHILSQPEWVLSGPFTLVFSSPFSAMEAKQQIAAELSIYFRQLQRNLWCAYSLSNETMTSSRWLTLRFFCLLILVIHWLMPTSPQMRSWSHGSVSNIHFGNFLANYLLKV